MSSQAKELNEEETGANNTLTTLGPLSLPVIWLLRWAQQQTDYIITGNCASGNDFESRLKPSAQIAHDFLYLGGGDLGWITIWILSPDWCNLKTKSCECGLTFRWSCRARWLCPLAMQLYVMRCAAIWCQLVVQLYGTVVVITLSTPPSPNFNIQNTCGNSIREKEANPSK